VLPRRRLLSALHSVFEAPEDLPHSAVQRWCRTSEAYQLAGPAGALVATLAIFFPSFVIVLVAAPWFATLRARRWFDPALHGALLSFVGLLAYVTLQFARTVGWSVGTGSLAAAALGALLAGVDVLWVVLGAGGIAAIAL
jgi:chromate transport protein ChrA